MRLDLHVHSREYSACAVASAETQINAAISAGLDGIVFTNHHKLVPGTRLAEWNAAFAPFRVYGGIEITVKEGEDILVFGVDDPALESDRWAYRGLKAFVRERSGFIALAHPFRYRDSIDPLVEASPPDAVELRSSNTPKRAEAKIRKFAKTAGAKLLSDSDAHSPESLGSFFNLVKGRLPEESELAAFLRAAEISCVSR